MDRDTPASPDLYAPDIAGVLDLESIDRDIFRGRNSASAARRLSLFGGQVAAQSLMAAGLTLDDDRRVHSLHGYFLRAGRVDRPVILRVDRDRDGRSFSSRHVSAIQDGKVIFSMLASFQLGEQESVLDESHRSEVPDPEDCGDARFDGLVETREVTKRGTWQGRMQFPDCLWARFATPLPDDPLTHACALVYMSDMGSGFGQVRWDRPVGGPSLDHAVWFHEPVRADEWMLLHMWPRKAMGIRGLYDGTIRDREGRLLASIAQEHLLIHATPANVLESHQSRESGAPE